MKTAKALVGNPTYFELEGSINDNELMYLLMDLPFGCNLNCLKCYRKLNVLVDNLDLDLRKKAIKEAKEMGAKVVCIPGEGEPLFHWGIVKDLVWYISSLGMITILYTNGSLLNRKKIRFLFDNNVVLIVGCDSFRSETYKELTDGGDVDKVKANLDIARSIYGASAMEQSGVTITSLGMITIVCRQNKDEIKAMKEWCDTDIFFICNYPIKKGSAINHWDSLVGTELEELKQISQQFTDTGFGGLTMPLRNGKCLALYNGITIDTNGDVLVCPASVDVVVGNIQDASLSDLRQRTIEYASEHGNPLCIARDGREKILKLHDGNIIQQLK